MNIDLLEVTMRHRHPAILAVALAFGCGPDTNRPPITLDLLMPPGCGSDSQCSAPTPRCELNSRTCVPCLLVNDNCPPGQRCVASNGTFACSSKCVKDSDCARSDAGNPTTCCGGACIDTTSDTQNCGKCGSTCFAPPNATPSCVAGACAVGKCNLGFLNCDHGDSNGCEVNASSDDRNCGACGKACTPGANQSSACMNGACMNRCQVGFADCDNNANNGCEANTNTDIKNCGACGGACVLANAQAVCKGGTCAVDACGPGFDDCNQSAHDGCESDLGQDVTHCGNCMNACKAANGTPVCRLGSCGIASCNMGFADCNSLVIDGCEVSTLADAKNCGGCARMCAGANSVQVCQQGACQIGNCSQGFSDCDKSPGNGCEINIAGDTTHCGGCGNACPVPANAVAACVNAQCGVGQCKFGFSDCNKDANDGCEVDLQTVQNCGQCGNACPAPANASAGCKAGVCGVAMCNNLFGDCDNNAQNGCEKNLAADTSNCGKCGTMCAFANAQAVCLGGQCGLLQCNQGFGNCDNNPANGCELNTTNDARNCGACGNVCPQQTPLCLNSKCAGVDLSGVFSQYQSAGRNVYLWKTPPCAALANYTNFCTARGLAWWSPKSAPDAQQLVTHAFNLDGTHTWIQVYGLKTTLGGTVGGYAVTVDSNNCVEASPGGNNFGAFRKWGCSFCNPQSNAQQNSDGQSCCWDKSHPYDWFVCEG